MPGFVLTAWRRRDRAGTEQTPLGQTNAVVHRNRRRARAMVLAWLLAFISLQVALAIGVEGAFGELRNPVQGKRENYLQGRIKEEPGRPLVLALGSSQTLCGLKAAQLNDGKSSDDPLVFNYALPSSGPFHQQTTLEGLLARGIKPDALILEVATFLLPVDPALADFSPAVYTWSEVESIARRRHDRRVHLEWFEARAMPWFEHRQAIFRRVLPKWMPADVRILVQWGRDTDAFGWYANLVPPAPGNIEKMRQTCEAQLRNFQVAPLHGAALRAMLQTCQSRGIRVILLLPPTGPAVFTWYGSQTESTLQVFLAGIQNEFQVPVIDARRWFASEEEFADSVHLTPAGAAKFTERFAREAAAFLASVKTPSH